jgi:hypothetical protein
MVEINLLIVGGKGSKKILNGEEKKEIYSS